MNTKFVFFQVYVYEITHDPRLLGRKLELIKWKSGQCVFLVCVLHSTLKGCLSEKIQSLSHCHSALFVSFSPNFVLYLQLSRWNSVPMPADSCLPTSFIHSVLHLSSENFKAAITFSSRPPSFCHVGKTSGSLFHFLASRFSIFHKKIVQPIISGRRTPCIF